MFCARIVITQNMTTTKHGSMTYGLEISAALTDGDAVGIAVGTVGARLGLLDGVSVGADDGALDGFCDGVLVGLAEGDALGVNEGAADGL